MYWLKIVAPGTEASDDLSDAPNGTGPYTFASRETGVSIELAANPDYWDGAPSDRVRDDTSSSPRRAPGSPDSSRASTT